MTYINKLFFWGCFVLEVIADLQAKFTGEHQVFGQYLKYRFLCKCRRREGDNPCGLPTTDTAFWVYLNINLPIHPWLFLFFFFFKILCGSVLRVSFCVLSYFPCIPFLNFAYKAHLLLISSSIADFT